MKADSATNPNWDIISFEDNGKSIVKTTYQVKEVDFNSASKNKSIQGNFPLITSRDTSVDYLMIVIFNADSNKNLLLNKRTYTFCNPKEPIIFQIPVSNLKPHIRNKYQVIISNDWYYTNKTITLNKIFDTKYESVLFKYKFYNYEKK